MFIINPFSKKKYLITDPKGKELLKCYIQHYQSGGLVNQYEEFFPVDCSHGPGSLWGGRYTMYRSARDCGIDADKFKLSWINNEKNRLSKHECKNNRTFNKNICECIETQNEDACVKVINTSDKPGHKIIANYELNKNGLKDGLEDSSKAVIYITERQKRMAQQLREAEKERHKREEVNKLKDS